MKRLVIAAPKLLFILYSLLPLCGIVGGFWGYSDFTLQNCRVSAILLAAGTLALSIPVLIRPRYASGSDVNPFFAAVLLPLLFVNWLFYLHADAWLENFIYMMICLLGSVYFLFIYVFKAYLWTVINRIGASIGTGLIIFCQLDQRPNRQFVDPLLITPVNLPLTSQIGGNLRLGFIRVYPQIL